MVMCVLHVGLFVSLTNTISWLILWFANLVGNYLLEVTQLVPI